VSFRYAAGINKPGFNPLATQTTTYLNNLYAWGYNGYGGLGLSNTTAYSSPKQVGSLNNWSFVFANQNSSSLGIKTDGSLWTWGYNAYGQLGLGNTTNYSSPKQVGALTNWSTAAMGNNHTLAIKTDGTLWAWGFNLVGNLGLNNTTYYSSPKQVGSLTSWSSIFTSSNSSFAIKTDGTLWSWGANYYGVLGLGNTTAYSSPKQVGVLTNWLKITGGSYSTLAIKTDGTLWSWGWNNNGQLGLGNITNYSSPIQVGLLTTWSFISVKNGFYALAIKTDGTLWSWGQNNRGQLGLGNTTYYSSPKQVGALTTWKTTSAGNSSGAIKTDNSLWMWGWNRFGGLGLNLDPASTYTTSSPQQVGSNTNWIGISNGSYFSLGLAY
jgi:alpha-tubulin suppressor-like RCC1 family protein